MLIYMNDIIIFSRNKKNHLKHVDEILNLLKKSSVILTLKKCHFAYLNIQALGHHVSKLELNIIEKKIQTIRDFQFFKILKKLKTNLGFFEYYRKFVK